MEKIRIIVENTSTGYSARAENYAIKVTGSNLKELKNHIAEAINLHFEENKIAIKNMELDFVLPDEDKDSNSWIAAKKKLEKLKSKEGE